MFSITNAEQIGLQVNPTDSNFVDRGGTPPRRVSSGAAGRSATVNLRLADRLDRLTAPGDLWKAEGDRIRCVACGHRCLVADGRRGICKVRFNDSGTLRVPYGYAAALQCDPVEKKPFFHVHPGSDALTFGMMGCDFHCGYCQNWVTSQALRDPSSGVPIQEITPEQLVDAATTHGARLMVSSYNEPLITAEWAVSVFKRAASAGLTCAFVSNGNATPEAIEYLKPWIRAYKVDLKSFSDRRYRTLGGTLEHVCETIRMVHRTGIWLEVLTLIVPGFNDDESELREIAAFIRSVSPEIPWHVTAFHRDYKMRDHSDTTAGQLIRAAEIGAEQGLHFVYAGNRPGRVGEWENTRCPSCRATLVSRSGYLIRDYRLTADGRCPECDAILPGVWPETGRHPVVGGQTINPFDQRLPRPVRITG